MKKHIIILSALTLLYSTAQAEYQVTQADIEQATKTRAMGMQIGLDKLSPEQWMTMATSMTADQIALTDDEKQAMACIAEQEIIIQYQAPIEVYARYLADKDFAAETASEHQKNAV